MQTTRFPRRRSSATRSSERGAALLEFALVLPILLMLVFGLITFGRAYHAKIELAGGVREGARALALGKSTGEAKTATANATGGLITDADVTTPSTCSPGVDGTARVRATYTFDFTIPLVRSDSLTITADGAMRCGL